MTKKKKSKRYTDEFKAEVLRAVETRGQRTIGEVAASLGVSEALIHGWKNNGNAKAAHIDCSETLDQEVWRLRREVADVRKDRDVLVKSITRAERRRRRSETDVVFAGIRRGPGVLRRHVSCGVESSGRGA